MVKFGKEFRKYQVTIWKNSYVNYKLLKQEIKAIKNNIEHSKDKPLKSESSEIPDIGHPSIKTLELIPEEPISIEVQDLHSLYNIRYGNELKRFIDLLEKEFRKCYIHFVSQEKELYKRVNAHCYSLSFYKDYVIIDIINEIKEIQITIRLAKQLNCFINDNVMAVKKILKKFDKKFQRYFGIITHKYIMTHLTSQNSDLEYLLQFKLIDETTTICEHNLNILLNLYKKLKGNNKINNVNENNNDNNINIEDKKSLNINNIEDVIDRCTIKINEYLDTIDELTYFKIQYREWFYYAKQNDRLVKNHPQIFENDIYNPILSSAYNKDSILEKCISSKNALKEVEKSQSPLSQSNKTNIILIYIQTCLYGIFLTGIYPVIPNYFSQYFEDNSKSLFLLPLIISFLANLLPFTFFIFIDNIDKNNFFLQISYIISYLLLFLSSFLLFFVQNNNSIINIILIIISRILVGSANNQMFNKKYITLYSPKFKLSTISKKYLLFELIGMILGPLITSILCFIDEFHIGSIKYTHFNCVGWFGFFISIIFCIIHFFFFIQPLSDKFFMVKDESNITGNKYYQRSESEINRKQYEKEQNLIYRKTYNTMKKRQKDNANINEDNNKDNNNIGNLIVKGVNIEEKDKDEDDNIIKTNNNLEEKLIDKNENEKNDLSLDNDQHNSLDVSTGGNIALTVKQKNMINEIEKVLEKRNEECNFNDMNQIPKTINSIINIEKKTFGYINQNLLILFIIFFVISIIKINLLLNYLYYIQEKLNSDNQSLGKLCLMIFLILFFKIFSILFIFPFYQVNYSFRIFMIISVTSLVLLNLPLIIDYIYDNEYIFIIMNILMVLACDIIHVCCSCYLSFLLSPEWKIFGKNVGHWTNYIIISGEIFGGIICLFLCSEEYVNHWVLVGISFALFICVLFLIFFTRILKIRGLMRVIRKTAMEVNLDNINKVK